MRPTSYIAIAVGLIAVLVAMYLVLRPAAPPPAAQIIRQVLRDAEEAAQSGSVGGIMEHVSEDYQDTSGLRRDQLRVLLARGLRDVRSRGLRYEVRVDTPVITFDKQDPDKAIVMTSVTVLNPSNRETIWSGTALTLTMRREEGRHLLVFPEERWRVVSTANLPGGISGEGGLL